jgi:hypothetical protein
VKRGDLVTVAAQGEYGKPRPAVLVQSDWLQETDSVLGHLEELVLAPVGPSDRVTDERMGAKRVDFEGFWEGSRSPSDRRPEVPAVLRPAPALDLYRLS